MDEHGHYGDTLIDLVADDEMFDGPVFLKTIEEYMERKAGKCFRQLNMQGKKIALKQLEALADMEELQNK